MSFVEFNIKLPSTKRLPFEKPNPFDSSYALAKVKATKATADNKTFFILNLILKLWSKDILFFNIKCKKTDLLTIFSTKKNVSYLIFRMLQTTCFFCYFVKINILA